MQRLATGAKLGQFEIVSLLGVGGMGEVYRARDTKLGRDVAIKILPGEFISDPERLARSEREARLLAALNHSHIGAIYGIRRLMAVALSSLNLSRAKRSRNACAKGPWLWPSHSR